MKNALFLFLLLCAFINGTAQVKNSEEGFISIFNGENLFGWEGDSVYWRVENGCLVGEVTPETILKRNTFIIWRGDSPENFELKMEYRISESGNSGLNYRSEEIDDLPFALKGYQCDIDGNNRYTGQNYEERGRTTLAYRAEIVALNTLADSLLQKPVRELVVRNAWSQRNVIGSLGDFDELATQISDDWNSCHVIVRDNILLHYINDILMSEVVDNDANNRTQKGLIGVQVHVGPPMKVEFRNIRIKILE